MPPPSKSSRYPLEYRNLARLAMEKGEVAIPSLEPSSLKRYLQEYFRALEREGDPTFNDSLIVTLSHPERKRPPSKGQPWGEGWSVVVKDRANNPRVKEIAAVLAQSSPGDEAQAAAERLLSAL